MKIVEHPSANFAICDQSGIADMLEEVARDIRAGERPDLRRMMLVSLDGVSVSVRVRGERGDVLHGVGMLELAKAYLMGADEE